MNYKLKIQFEGTRYLGWQKQKTNANTIQGKIETVLGKLFEENIQVIGGSRTDSGVHAIEYTASFEARRDLEEKAILEYLTMYLPEDIVIMEVARVEEKFHARYNAKTKTYLYKIDNSKCGNVFAKKYAWHVEKKLNIDKMEDAAKLLVGEHDFKGFTNKSKNKNTVKTITSIEIKNDSGFICIAVEGNAFLLNMVRIIVGTLKEIGEGSRSLESINEILLSGDRELSGERAVARGLYLLKTKY